MESERCYSEKKYIAGVLLYTVIRIISNTNIFVKSKSIRIHDLLDFDQKEAGEKLRKQGSFEGLLFVS